MRKTLTEINAERGGQLSSRKMNHKQELYQRDLQYNGEPAGWELLFPAFLTFASSWELRAAIFIGELGIQAPSAGGENGNQSWSCLGTRGWECWSVFARVLENTGTRGSICAFDLQARTPLKPGCPQSVLEDSRDGGKAFTQEGNQICHGVSEISLVGSEFLARRPRRRNWNCSGCRSAAESSFRNTVLWNTETYRELSRVCCSSSLLVLRCKSQGKEKNQFSTILNYFLRIKMLSLKQEKRKPTTLLLLQEISKFPDTFMQIRILLWL